jgi:hypothetical protein
MPRAAPGANSPARGRGHNRCSTYLQRLLGGCRDQLWVAFEPAFKSASWQKAWGGVCRRAVQLNPQLQTHHKSEGRGEVGGSRGGMELGQSAATYMPSVASPVNPEAA